MTDFFLKKYVKLILVGILVFIFMGILNYVGAVSKKARVQVGKHFYFLVSTSTHLEASTHFVSWSGGSGYLLDDNEQEYVVFSVYLQQEAALQIQENLQEATKVVKRSAEYIYAPSKKISKDIEGAFQTYYSWLIILEQAISRLVYGCTQQSCKQVLNTIKQQMDYSSKKYNNSFSAYANVCRRGAEQLTKRINGTVYVKDLRYLLCEFCVAYCDLVESFSI